jgi:hypothetical protein
MISNSPTIQDSQPLIVELLLARSMLDSKSLDVLREAQGKSNSPIEQLLVQKNLVTDRDIAQVYSQHLMIPLYEPAADGPNIDHELHRMLPEKLCRDQLIVPVAHGATLDVAFVSPHEMLIIDELQLITGCAVRPLISTQSVVERLIEYLYNAEGTNTDFAVGTGNFEQMAEEEDDGGGETTATMKSCTSTSLLRPDKTAA